MVAPQVEGNSTNCDWRARAREGGSRIVERSGDGCDSYHRYPEDIRLLVDNYTFVYSSKASLHWLGDVANANVLADKPPQATASDAPFSTAA